MNCSQAFFCEDHPTTEHRGSIGCRLWKTGKSFLRKSFALQRCRIACIILADRGLYRWVESGFENSCDVVLDSGLCCESDAGFEITSDVFLVSGFAKWAIPDSRPGVIFFSIPDCARDLIPKSESLRKQKKTPSRGRGLGIRNTGELSRITGRWSRSEEHTSELQSLRHLVCRLLL